MLDCQLFSHGGKAVRYLKKKKKSSSLVVVKERVSGDGEVSATCW